MSAASAPKSSSGLDYHQNIFLGASLATNTTSYVTVMRTSRSLRWREFAITARSTITSSAPVTANFRAEIWNLTDATLIARSTITGPTTGTRIQRGVPVNIATLSEVLNSQQTIAADKVVEFRAVGAAATLSANLIDACLTIQADYID